MTDEFLESLLGTIERIGGGLGITLNVNGVVISGVMITEEEYISETALRIARGRYSGEEEPIEPSEEDLDAVRTLFNWQPRNIEDPVNYAHLRDTTIHFGPIPGNIAGGLWRGRAEAIDGFQFGRPSSSDDD